MDYVRGNEQTPTVLRTWVCTTPVQTSKRTLVSEHVKQRARLLLARQSKQQDLTDCFIIELKRLTTAPITYRNNYDKKIGWWRACNGPHPAHAAIMTTFRSTPYICIYSLSSSVPSTASAEYEGKRAP